jgi:tetratricopeptide (TPR) repeat protein
MKFAALREAGVLVAALIGGAATVGAQDGREAIAQYRARHYDEARAALVPLAHRRDASGEVLFYAGRAVLRARDYGLAVRFLERAVAQDGSRSDYALWLGRAYAQDAINGSKLRLAFVAKRSKNWFERAIALDPNNIDARIDLGQYLLVAPSMAGGSVPKAREQAAEIAKRNVLWGHLAAAAIAVAQKDTVTAEREHRLAIAAAPDSVEGYTALAQFLYTRGRYPEAYTVVKQTMKDYPDEPVPQFQLGVLAAGWKQKLDEGEAALKQYVAMLPRDTDPAPSTVHFYLGSIYREQGKTDAARAEFREAVRLNPKSARSRKALEDLGKR